MPSDRNALRAGVFIVVSIILILAVIVAIKGVGRLLEPQQARTVVFGLGDDVGGLRIGDDVRVGGVKVGIVRSLTIEPASENEPARIVVDFRMPRRIILRQGARVGVQGTITGASWLNFDSLGEGQPLADGAALVGRPGAYAVLMKTATDLAPQLRQLTSDLRTVTLPKIDSAAGNIAQLAADARGRINNLVGRYDNVTDRLAEVMVKLRDLLGDTTPDLRGTLANANAVTTTLKQKLPPAMDQANTLLTKLNTSMDKAQGSLSDLSVTMSNARAISSSVRSVLARNRTRLDGIIRSGKQASDNLKFATEEIRRSPWRLLYKPRPDEMANLNLFDATRAFADGAQNLSDASGALRDALNDPRSDPKLIQKLIDQLDASFSKFQQVEKTLWGDVKQ